MKSRGSPLDLDKTKRMVMVSLDSGGEQSKEVCGSFLSACSTSNERGGDGEYFEGGGGLGWSAVTAPEWVAAAARVERKREVDIFKAIKSSFHNSNHST